MKHSALAKISGIGAALLSVGLAIASDAPQGTETAAPVINAQVAARPVVPPRAYGVDEVIKLAQAQVSEDVIAAYIQTSGAVYNLKPADIVELHQMGVSDRILTLMLSQGHVTPANTNQPVMVSPVPVDPMAYPAQLAGQPAPDANQLFIPGENAFEIAADSPAPTVEPASTVYTIANSGSSGYSPYTVYGGWYPSYGYASSVIRIGGFRHFHSHSYHRR